MVKSANKLFIV